MNFAFFLNRRKNLQIKTNVTGKKKERKGKEPKLILAVN